MNNILEVLMYLFERHMQDNCTVDINDEAIYSELKEAGFNIEEINGALNWLDGLEESSAKLESVAQNTFRILSPQERNHISAECWGFLLFLERISILDPLCREIVLDRLMGLTPERVDLQQVKWVTLMVLFNQPDRKEALQAMEQLVLAEGTERPN